MNKYILAIIYILIFLIPFSILLIVYSDTSYINDACAEYGYTIHKKHSKWLVLNVNCYNVPYNEGNQRLRCSFLKKKCWEVNE